MAETANTKRNQPQASCGLHPFLTWSELWIFRDQLADRQFRLNEKLAQRECPIMRTELTRVTNELHTVIDRLQQLASRT